MDPKLIFEQVYPLYQKISESEQHFNNLQLEYRKLASGWLLAVFAGVGFLLSLNELPIDRWILIHLVGVGGFVGLVLIWLLDLIVYHRLLRSYFLTGVQLERLYKDFLPPTRSLMRRIEDSHNRMLDNVILFYKLSCYACMVVSVTAVAVYSFLPLMNWWLILVGVVTLIVQFVTLFRLTGSTRKSEPIRTRIGKLLFSEDEIIQNMHSEADK